MARNFEPFFKFLFRKFLVTNDRFDATENVGLSGGGDDLELEHELELVRNLDERKDWSETLPGKKWHRGQKWTEKVSLVTRVPKIEFEVFFRELKNINLGTN